MRHLLCIIFTYFDLFTKHEKSPQTLEIIGFTGILFSERAGIRTPDNLIKSQVLYHLSYTPVSSNMLIIKENAQNRNRTSDTRIFSPLLYQLSYLGIHHISYCQCKLRGQDLNLRPSGYEPDELPDCSTPRYEINGWRWIRTTEAICSRFTVCPLWPLGNPSINTKHNIQLCPM